jgi:NAD(P)-dependent dehydrogenase (short-subunit alcohol dehydrogenase family)
MKDFSGRIAVVTGGGSGMGRELVRQLVAEACNVATCDVSAEGMVETTRLCEAAGLPQGLRVTTHIADVADAAQVQRFRDEVAERHGTDKIHLLFNNAGIGGGGSMFAHNPEEWERTFNICWGGVVPAPSCRCCKRPRRATSSTPAASTASGRRSGRIFRTPPTARQSSRSKASARR